MPVKQISPLFMTWWRSASASASAQVLLDQQNRQTFALEAIQHLHDLLQR